MVPVASAAALQAELEAKAAQILVMVEERLKLVAVPAASEATMAVQVHLAKVELQAITLQVTLAAVAAATTVAEDRRRMVTLAADLLTSEALQPAPRLHVLR